MDEDTQSPETKKGGVPVMTIAVVAAIMIVEAAAVMLFMRMTSGGAAAQAELLEGESPFEAFAEVELVTGRFQNVTTGRVFDWEVEIFLKVRTEHLEFVNTALEARRNELRSGVATIIRRASHSQLKEPSRTTVSRQVHALLDEVLGTDSIGESYVDSVLIPACDGYPADF